MKVYTGFGLRSGQQVPVTANGAIGRCYGQTAAALLAHPILVGKHRTGGKQTGINSIQVCIDRSEVVVYLQAGLVYQVAFRV